MNELLRLLGSVLGAATTTVVDADGIEGSADNVVADTGKVFDTTATNQDHGVFLKVVAFARDVSRDFNPVGQTDTRHLTEGRVRFLGGGRVDTSADAAFLRARFEGRAVAPVLHLFAAFADELVNRRHGFSFFRHRASPDAMRSLSASDSWRARRRAESEGPLCATDHRSSKAESLGERRQAQEALDDENKGCCGDEKTQSASNGATGAGDSIEAQAIAGEGEEGRSNRRV